MPKNTFPYVGSSGPLVSMIGQLRKSFPTIVDAGTLKKLGIAPKNESYVICILKFLGIIGSDGKKIDDAAKVFYLHEEAAFRKAFSSLIETAYSELFALRGVEAWTLDTSALIGFFRNSDQSSELVGSRQANTFRTLSSLAGHTTIASSNIAGPRKTAKTTTAKVATAKKTPDSPKNSAKESATHSATVIHSGVNTLGLSIRIEVNLPAIADQQIYDMIFQSIRKNLID